MPCIMTLLALAAPRLVVALLWFFTHWFRGVFDNILWPIIHGPFSAPSSDRQERNFVLQRPMAKIG